MEFNNWDTTFSVEGELLNNLILVDKIVESKGYQDISEFHILGGAALIFNGINYSTTLDIDTANTIDERVKEDISYFINDSASEVVTLPANYCSRLIPFKKSLFNNISVFILSCEDIVYTKLSSDRAKDTNQLRKTNILSVIDLDKIKTIIECETNDASLKSKLLSKLSMLCYS